MNAIDLCNNALALLGEKPIDGIDKNGNGAQRLCYLHYHPVRREVLCVNRWTFAVKRATLYSSETVDENMHAVPHTLPTDCLRVLEVGTPGWTLRSRQIFARRQKIKIKYTRDEEDLDLWSADALFPFTHCLAADMCMQLVGNATLRAELMAQYGAKLKSITNPTK